MLWLALVSSSCGFWRALASSCRPFGGVLASSSRGVGGRSCPVGFWTGFLEAGLMEACLLEGVFVEAVFGGFLGWGLMGASWGLLGAFWGLLGFPGASWGLVGFAGVPSWGLLSSWELLGLLRVSWGLLGLLGVSWSFLGLGASCWVFGTPEASWSFLGFPASSRKSILGLLRHPGASWSLWLAFVSSSCGFWRVLAPSCRPFGGCLRPVVVAWAGARVRPFF